MAISKLPKASAEFIAGAPDSKAKTESDGPHQVGLRLPVDLLAKVDAAAKKLSLTRAGFIKMTLANALDKSA
jgi:hypothetical protein